MIEPDLTEQEDPKLQVDPVLTLSGGEATFGQKLLSAIVMIVVVLGTLYGVVHQGGEASRSTVLASSAVLSETTGQAR